MKNSKFIPLLIYILCLSDVLAFPQSLREDTLQVNKYKIDKESKFLGDSLIVATAIKDIEQAINNFNTDKVLYYFTDKREKIDKRNELLNDKRNMLSNSFAILDSTYISDGKNKDKANIFEISNVNLTIGDTIIIANVDIELKEDHPVSDENNDMQLAERNSDPENEKSHNVINDNWVFEKVYGQWKLVSCDNFMKMLNDLKVK